MHPLKKKGYNFLNLSDRFFNARSFPAELLPRKCRAYEGQGYERDNPKGTTYTDRRHGKRKIVNLRISVTDRCNFRCTYCMPADNVEFMDRGELLSFEEITQVARVVAKMGIYRLRLTGGEPLLRKNLPTLVEMLDGVEGIEDIALTTNAFFLTDQAAALREAGLKRLNISLDALDKEKFTHVNRRDCLQQVLDGIAESRRVGFESIKINAVAVKNFSEEEILKLVDMGREQDLEIRFIEFMPLDADQTWERDKVLFGHEIIDHHQRKIRAGSDQRLTWRSDRPVNTRSPTEKAKSASSLRSVTRSATTATASA